MTRLPLPLAAAGLAAVAVCARPADAQDQPPTWREAFERFERSLDDLMDDLAAVDEAPEAMAGIFVPAEPTPAAAAELPGRWTPLAEMAEPPERLVLLIHGLDEPGDIWMDLAPALVEAGHPVARFEYPNDQRVHDSAAALLASLRAAREAGVEEVALVVHSMGGLVAFDALTGADGYAGEISGRGDLPRVTRMIAVGTPWAGSPWAKLRPLAEVREQVQRWWMDESWDLRPLLDYRRDGSGQAANDLAEGSALVRELAGRPTPEGLPLTNIVGRIVTGEAADASWIEESGLLRRIMEEDDLAELASEFQAAAGELGDGAVPLASALARDGGDNVVLPVNHRALVRKSPLDFITGPTPQGPPGIPIILERLAADLEEPDPDRP